MKQFQKLHPSKESKVSGSKAVAGRRGDRRSGDTRAGEMRLPQGSLTTIRANHKKGKYANHLPRGYRQIGGQVKLVNIKEAFSFLCASAADKIHKK